MNGHPSAHRRLPDGRIDLPEVTLIAASSVAIGETLRALRESMRGIRFAEVILLTDADPRGRDCGGIRVEPIARLGSAQAYSRFMINDLVHHVRSAFALCVQWDGYVLDAGNWRDAFLDYDYIGAPWPHLGAELMVGNGGFSLRSRRLLEAVAQAGLDADIGEDLAICCHGRARLEREYGLRFAPPALALHFAYERTPPSAAALGFHGAFNMPGLARFEPAGFPDFYRALPPGLVGRIENRDLFRHALRRRQWRLAWHVLQYELRERGLPLTWLRAPTAAMATLPDPACKAGSIAEATP